MVGDLGNFLVFDHDTFTQSENQASFAAIYDNKGNLKHVWKYGGGHGDLYSRGIAWAAPGSFYLYGDYGGYSIPLGNDTLLKNNTQPSYGIFIAKIDTQDHVVWFKQIFGKMNSDILRTDSKKNIYIDGTYIDTLTLGKTMLISVNESTFLAKYDSSGTEQWATRLISTKNNNPFSFVTEGNGNSYICGDFMDSLPLPGDTLISHGQYDFYLVNINPYGTIKDGWSGGTAWYDQTCGAAIGRNGNIFVIGSINDNVHPSSVVDTCFYGTNSFTTPKVSTSFIALISPFLVTGRISPIPNGDDLIRAFPDPFDNKLTVEITGAYPSNASLYLYDLMGNTIYKEEDIKTNTGKLTYTIDTGKLHMANGMYFLKISTGTNDHILKVLKTGK